MVRGVVCEVGVLVWGVGGNGSNFVLLLWLLGLFWVVLCCSADKIATWQGKSIMTSAGPCTVPSLVDVFIK